jgi:galactonate dehydratase
MTRRNFLRSAAGLGLAAGFNALHAAAGGIGVPLKITNVETLILRDPPKKDAPEDFFVDMTPLGAMTGDIGLANRLERSETVRQGGYQQTLLVKVTTDQGVVGWGESHAVMTPRVTQTIISDMLKPILLGQDARQIEALWEKMYSTQRLRGYGTGYFTRALAGVDIALWDIVGKAAGMPVYQLLGGKFRDSIPTYVGVGGDTPEAMRDAAQRNVERGWTTMKTSLAKGRGRNARDVNRAISAADVLQGKGQLLIDSLAGYQLHEAMVVGRRLDELGNVGWWEDVLMPEDIDGLARLNDALDMAICAGEQYSNRFQFRELFERRCVDIINPDTARIGITETKRIAIMADAHNVLWSPHSSMGSAPYRASAIHLCAATPNSVIIEGGDSYEQAFGNRILSRPLPYRPGSVGVPDAPGLGFEFDAKELARITVG